ncbi:MAG: hypothetical protein LBU02_00750 [Rickettsiales bacterium]|nr:hypothetical protein [Rickettsiales bacterium]
MRNSDGRNLYQIPMVIGQIKLPVNNGTIPAPPPVIPVPPFFVIQVVFSCHSSARHWDPGYYFSNKYLRNLPNEKKRQKKPRGG